jgi:hypothetical protein
MAALAQTELQLQQETDKNKTSKKYAPLITEKKWLLHVGLW